MEVILIVILLGVLIVIICLTIVLVFIFKRKKTPVSVEEGTCEDLVSPTRTNHRLNMNGNIALEREGLYSKPWNTSTPCRKEDYNSCRVDLHDSSASSNSNCNSSLSDSSSSEDALDQTQTFGDIVERNVGSCSRSDINCQSPGCRNQRDECVHEAYITLIDQQVSSGVEQFKNNLKIGQCQENSTGTSNISQKAVKNALLRKRIMKTFHLVF